MTSKSARLVAAVVLSSGAIVATVFANQNQSPKDAPEAPKSEAPKSEEPKKVEKATFPEAWFYMGPQKPLLDKKAPELEVTNWQGGAEMKLESLKGKIVVLDFWGTWCPPCRAAIPHTNEMSKKYKDKDVQIIGIHSRRMNEKMAETAKRLSMEYPTAADANGKMEKAYSVAFWPFYVLIDREGVVRAAGLNPEFLGNAIDALLKEQPPKAS